jgi:2-keto-4-pentenoate hydratase/2-oxohepta-3-ene-1,7-dioic acid hydratase in catechol pathway
VLIARAVLGGRHVYGIVDDLLFRVCEGNPFVGLSETKDRADLNELQLITPIRPSRTFVVLSGFNKDGRKTGEVKPSEREPPRLMCKLSIDIAQPGGPIRYPASCEKVGIEAELALVIRATPETSSVEEVADCILGYTVFNDVTALDILAGGDIFLSKSVNGLSSIGPWIRTDVSPQEIERGLSISSRVNGVETQRGTTATYKWPPTEIVRYFAQYVKLMPGDVISLGTPPPAALVNLSDAVECEVEGIGVLANTII